MSENDLIEDPQYDELIRSMNGSIRRIPPALRFYKPPSEGRWHTVADNGQLLLGIGKLERSPSYWSTFCAECEKGVIMTIRQELEQLGSTFFPFVAS